MISALGVDQARSTTFLVSYDMPKTLLCLPDDQAKEQMGKIMLKAMLQVAPASSIVSSNRTPLLFGTWLHFNRNEMRRS